jgi:hypothetical protein
VILCSTTAAIQREDGHSALVSAATVRDILARPSLEGRGAVRAT